MNRAVKSGGNWAIIVFSAAVLYGFSPATRRLELIEQPSRTVARAGTGLLALGLAVPLRIPLGLWWTLVQHARRNYERTVAGPLILVYSIVIGLVVSLYTALGLWLLRLTWRTLDGWSLKMSSPTLPPSRSGWIAALVLAGVTVWVAWRFVLPMVVGTVQNYATSIRGLGIGRFLRGIPRLILLRICQPGRDFLLLTPGIAEMWLFALSACFAAAIPIPFVAIALSSTVATFATMSMLDKLRPPTLLFLGASEDDSFRAFVLLKDIWGPVAVTFLNRENDAGRRLYDIQRAVWERQGRIPRGVFYDPTIPRVWSLRTRPSLWAHSVRLLINYVPVIVIDVRQPSDYVRAEVEWLADPTKVAKTWFLVAGNTPDPMFSGLIPPGARLITEEALLEMPPYSYRRA
jgi:hypothetical protein